MGRKRDYIDDRRCPFCDKVTKQRCHDDGHERDSSHDTQECLECGSSYLGMTGWRDPQGKKINA